MHKTLILNFALLTKSQTQLNMTENAIKILKDKLATRKREVNQIYDELIEGTNAALNDFTTDEISILKARVDKIEQDLANSDAADKIGTNYLASTIVLNINSKLKKYKNNYEEYDKKLENELDDIEDKTILEKRIGELNENLESIDSQIAKDLNLDPENSTNTSIQWRALIRQFIWINLIGKSENIGRIRKNIPSSPNPGIFGALPGSPMIIPEPSIKIDGSGNYFVSDIYNPSLADRLIKTLPTESDNFLDRTLNRRKNSRATRYQIPENITSNFIISNSRYGRQIETATEPSVKSVKDEAYEELFKWIDQYNKQLMDRSNEFFQLMDKFDNINSIIKIEDFQEENKKGKTKRRKNKK